MTAGRESEMASVAPPPTYSRRGRSETLGVAVPVRVAACVPVDERLGEDVGEGVLVCVGVALRVRLPVPLPVDVHVAAELPVDEGVAAGLPVPVVEGVAVGEGVDGWVPKAEPERVPVGV